MIKYKLKEGYSYPLINIVSTLKTLVGDEGAIFLKFNHLNAEWHILLVIQ